MRLTQVLQQLKRIVWMDVNVYSTNPAMKAIAEASVRSHYDSKGLEGRGVTVAKIR